MKATLLDSFIMGAYVFFIIEIIRRYKKKSPQKSPKGKLNSIIDTIRDSHIDVKTTDTDIVKMEKSKNEAIRMENPNPNVVEILDERSYGGLMFKCKVCGQVWFPSILTGGSINRSAWQCPNGCKQGE